MSRMELCGEHHVLYYAQNTTASCCSTAYLHTVHQYGTQY